MRIQNCLAPLPSVWLRSMNIEIPQQANIDRLETKSRINMVASAEIVTVCAKDPGALLKKAITHLFRDTKLRGVEGRR